MGSQKARYGEFNGFVPRNTWCHNLLCILCILHNKLSYDSAVRKSLISLTALEITGGSKSLLGCRASTLEITARASFFSLREHFRLCCGIPFEIALLRTVRCFELCFVRLHRHCKVHNIYISRIIRKEGSQRQSGRGPM